MLKRKKRLEIQRETRGIDEGGEEEKKKKRKKGLKERFKKRGKKT